MNVKLVPVVFVIGLTICAGRVESQLLTGTPTESASPTKHLTHKKAEASSHAGIATEPSAADASTGSPKLNRTRKKPTTEASPTATPTPIVTPSPHKFRFPQFRFPRLFKPKISPSP